MTKSPTPATKAPPLMVTAPVAAAILGLSRRQFDRLTGLGVLPRGDGKRFDLYKVGPAYLLYVRDGRAETSELAEARLKLSQAQREAIEQRTRERSGELVELADVSRILSATIVSIAAALEGLPGRVSGTLAGIDQPARIHEVLTDEARRIRNAAADELGRIAAIECRDAAPTATETDRRGLG